MRTCKYQIPFENKRMELRNWHYSQSISSSTKKFKIYFKDLNGRLITNRLMVISFEWRLVTLQSQDRQMKLVGLVGSNRWQYWRNSVGSTKEFKMIKSISDSLLYFIVSCKAYFVRLLFIYSPHMRDFQIYLMYSSRYAKKIGHTCKTTLSDFKFS